MTLSELRDALSHYLDKHPHMEPLVVRFAEVGYPDHVQEPTGEIELERDGGAVYVVLPTTEP